MNDEQESILFQLVLNLNWQWIWLAIGLSIPCWFIYNIFFHPLAKYPGPWIAKLGIPILENDGGSVWQFYQTLKGKYVWELEKVHDRYGEVVRIGRNHLSFSSSFTSNQIYSHGQSFQFQKTKFYKSFQVYPQHPSLFSETNGDAHSNFRRAISSAYSMNNLIKLEEYIEPLIEEYCTQLNEQIDNQPLRKSAIVDMAKWNHFFAMDAVGELAFGENFNLCKNGGDQNGFLKGVSNLSHWGSMAGWLPILSKPIRIVLKNLSGQPDGPKSVGMVTEPLIEKRFGGEKQQIDQRQDMLANFCQSKNPKTGKYLQKKEVLRTAISVISAGSDTSATALTTMIGYLIRNPKYYQQIQEEIDTAFEEGILTWPIKYSQSVKLDFLQACIKETLRIHPPISMSLPRQIGTKEGVVLETETKEQIVLGKGCQVSVSPFVLHRNPIEFGQSARQFDPNRWLHLNEEERKENEKKLFMFGGGSRQCIGKNISLMEINKTLPTLLRLFDFSLVSDENWMGKDSNGKMGKEVPWKCRSTWFLEVETFPINIAKRQGIEME